MLKGTYTRCRSSKLNCVAASYHRRIISSPHQPTFLPPHVSFLNNCVSALRCLLLLTSNEEGEEETRCKEACERSSNQHDPCSCRIDPRAHHTPFTHKPDPHKTSHKTQTTQARRQSRVLTRRRVRNRRRNASQSSSVCRQRRLQRTRWNWTR